MRAPMVIRWPGVIKPGTVKNDIFASLDWVPTLVDIAGGPKGDGLKKRIEAGQYPGIVKTTLDGVDQIDYLKASRKSARDTFFYYSGKDPSAVRYKNWKMYFAMVSDSPAGFITGVLPYHWTQVVNIKRDPFETSIGSQYKTLFGMGGALASPSTAYVYDWNMLPIGQALWLKELETYINFPPLQDPASYNLEQVMQQVKNMKTEPVARANNSQGDAGAFQWAPASLLPAHYKGCFDAYRSKLARHARALDLCRTGICPIGKALDTGRHADLQTQPEHRVHHRRASVDGMSLRSGRRRAFPGI